MSASPISLWIIGAGSMGRGLAHVLAENGDHVTLVDVSDERLRLARQAVRREHLAGELEGKCDGAFDDLLTRINFVTSLEGVSRADLVIENISEQVEGKMSIHRELASLTAGSNAPILVNSSVVPIGLIAQVYDSPGRVVGTHFMNPPTRRKGVEVIRQRTDRVPTVAAEVARTLLARSFRPTVVLDDVGYVINRALMPFVNEAIGSFSRGCGEAGDIDRLFVDCLGHRAGPLATADLIGLDVVRDSLLVLAQLTGDSRYIPHPLLEEYIGAGKLGRKSGEGFFSYV